VLFGAINPSGKLPVTIPKHLDQLPPFDMASLNVEHGFLQGYRFLGNTEPEFPFGFGLSYTRFTLDGLYLRRHDHGFQITVDVTNIGDVAGAAVPQIYVSNSNSTILRANITMKGFGRVNLEPGESASVIFEVTDEALAYYDEASASWRMESCEYTFSCGFDSATMLLGASWRYDKNTTATNAEGVWQPV